MVVLAVVLQNRRNFISVISSAAPVLDLHYQQAADDNCLR